MSVCSCPVPCSFLKVGDCRFHAPLFFSSSCALPFSCSVAIVIPVQSATVNFQIWHWPLHCRTRCNFFALLTTREVEWYIILVMSVCLYVCQTITFESLDIGSSYLDLWHISMVAGQVRIRRSSGQGHRSQKVENSYSSILNFDRQ